VYKRQTWYATAGFTPWGTCVGTAAVMPTVRSSMRCSLRGSGS